MIISDHKKLKDIQKEFNEKFPFLKIEFYAHKHKWKEGSPVQETLDKEQTIGTVRTKHTEGDMSISGSQEVGTFEQNFYTQYGLSVQVFRKSGSLWLQTSTTDHWTLDKQNEKGALSEKIG